MKRDKRQVRGFQEWQPAFAQSHIRTVGSPDATKHSETYQESVRNNSRVIAVPSLSHCRGFVVAIMVSPSSSHCRGFVIAIMVSPSHLSRFCRRCCGVTFVSVAVLSSPSRCCLRRHIVTVSSSSRCCLHRRIVAVSSSRFHRRRRRVAFIVTLSQCSLPFHHRRRGVAFIVASSWCRHCGFVVAVAVSFLLSHCRHLAVSSLQSHRCVVVVMVVVMVASWSWSSWSWSSWSWLWSRC